MGDKRHVLNVTFIRCGLWLVSDNLRVSTEGDKKFTNLPSRFDSNHIN